MTRHHGPAGSFTSNSPSASDSRPVVAAEPKIARANHYLPRATGPAPLPVERVVALKADYLRRIVAPRLLWDLDALTDAERNYLVLHRPRLGRLTRKKMPDWLLGPEPWV